MWEQRKIAGEQDDLALDQNETELHDFEAAILDANDLVGLLELGGPVWSDLGPVGLAHVLVHC